MQKEEEIRDQRETDSRGLLVAVALFRLDVATVPFVGGYCPRLFQVFNQLACGTRTPILWLGSSISRSTSSC